MQTPTGQAVLGALQNDPRYTGMQQDARDIITPYITAAPEALGEDLLCSKVSAISFVQAKLVFLEYCLKNGFAEKSANLLVTAHEKAKIDPTIVALKIKLPKLPPLKNLVKQTEKALNVLIDYYKKILVALPKTTGTGLYTEPELLARLGLSVLVAEQSVTEGLTVADLLVLEPASILLNGGNK